MAAAQGDAGLLSQQPPSKDDALAVRWHFARCLLPDAYVQQASLNSSSAFLAHHRLAGRLRQRFAPYLLTCSALQREHGWPALHGIASDPPALTIGEALIAAPVVTAGATQRVVLLPDGAWYDFWTDAPLTGAHPLVGCAPLERLPLYVRAGMTLPLRSFAPDRSNAVMRVYAGNGESALYEDGGHADDYGEGNFRWVYVTVTMNGNTLRLTRRAAGRYVPESEYVTLELVGLEGRPRAIQVDRRNAPVWYWECGRAEMCLSDDFSEVEVTLA